MEGGYCIAIKKKDEKKHKDSFFKQVLLWKHFEKKVKFSKESPEVKIHESLHRRMNCGCKYCKATPHPYGKGSLVINDKDEFYSFQRIANDYKVVWYLQVSHFLNNSCELGLLSNNKASTESKTVGK